MGGNLPSSMNCLTYVIKAVTFWMPGFLMEKFCTFNWTFWFFSSEEA